MREDGSQRFHRRRGQQHIPRELYTVQLVSEIHLKLRLDILGICKVNHLNHLLNYRY